MPKKVFIHTGFWLLFFFFWYQIVYIYIENFQNRLLFTLLDVLLIVVSFYFVYLIAVPKLLLKKKLLLFGIVSTAGIAGIGLLLLWISKTIFKSDFVHINFIMSWSLDDLYDNRFFIAVFGAIAGLTVKLAIEWSGEKKRMQQAEYEKAKAELDYLRNQVNPHFLFNALNTIYFQLNESTDIARSSLLKFSDMLRYQLYECNEETVLVRKEVEYLDNYIKIQKLRKNNDYTIEFIFNENWGSKRVAPMLLIPFVENAFKHVSSFSSAANIIKVTVTKTDNYLLFTSINSFDRMNRKTGGIGIENVKRRLELIYPDKHILEVSEQSDLFCVTLKIAV